MAGRQFLAITCRRCCNSFEDWRRATLSPTEACWLPAWSTQCSLYFVFCVWQHCRWPGLAGRHDVVQFFSRALVIYWPGWSRGSRVRCRSMGRWPRLAPADMDCPIVDSSSFFQHHNLPQPTVPTQSCLALKVEECTHGIRRLHRQYSLKPLKNIFPKEKSAAGVKARVLQWIATGRHVLESFPLHLLHLERTATLQIQIQIHHKQSADTTQWVTQIQKYNTGTV